MQDLNPNPWYLLQKLLIVKLASSQTARLGLKDEKLSIIQINKTMGLALVV